MEEKSKKGGAILAIIKSCLFGLVITLIGTVIFAVVLKFADMPDKLVSYINDIIKAISLFVVVLFLKRFSSEKLLVRAVIAGVIYWVLSFIIFSILNGGFSFDLSILYDWIFAVIVAVVATVIFKLSNKKTA